MDFIPCFTVQELDAIEEDARNGLMKADGNQWVGMVIDLCRALRHELDVRLHG